MQLRELQTENEELSSELTATKREKGALAKRLSPIGDMAETAVANVTAYGTSYADARFAAPGQNSDRGLVQGLTAGGAAAVALLARKNPMARAAAKSVAIGASCAISAKAGRTAGLKARLKDEAAKAAKAAASGAAPPAEKA
jgi:hypothetical protein